MRKTKIVATLGPASYDEQEIGKLVEAGVDIFRQNLSHGSQDEHRVDGGPHAGAVVANRQLLGKVA